MSNKEIADFARIVGKDDIGEFGLEDLVALKREVSEATGVRWLNDSNP